MNQLDDLNRALHAQLERLSEASGDNLKSEIERSRAVSGVAKNLIQVASIAMEHEKSLCTIPGYNSPKMLQAPGVFEE